MSKRVREEPGKPWEVPGGCLVCGGDLAREVTSARGVEFPTRCLSCGRELAVTLGEATTAVRRPYGAETWEDVESSNLAAAGRVGADLLLRFKRGSLYRFTGAGALLPELLAAESKGRFFTARVRPLPAVLLCVIYGCPEPAERETNQLMCRRHLDVSAEPRVRR